MTCDDIAEKLKNSRIHDSDEYFDCQSENDLQVWDFENQFYKGKKNVGRILSFKILKRFHTVSETSKILKMYASN